MHIYTIDSVLVVGLLCTILLGYAGVKLPLIAERACICIHTCTIQIQ
jgi:hypothetical protein